MKISSKKLNRIIKESIDNVLCPLDTKTRNRLEHFMYASVNKSGISGRRFRDNDWSGLKAVDELLETAYRFFLAKNGFGSENCNISRWCKNGGYKKSSDGMSLWKEYILSFEYDGTEVLRGHVNCNACGSMEDPFDTYDVTFGFYK